MYTHELFQYLDDAEENCSYNPLCMGVDDYKCEGRHYMLCLVGSEVMEDRDNCFYEKSGDFFLVRCCFLIF